MTKNKQLLSIVYISLFAVLMSVCAWIYVPFVVPFTMQTFAVFLALNFLGGRRGSVAILLYLSIGAVGVPVFSGFSAGIGALLGQNGGYLFGWLLGGLVCWLFDAFPIKKSLSRLISSVIALLLCYAVGTVWYVAVYTRTGGEIGVLAALTGCVFPFILPDVIKLALAYWLSARLRRISGLTK